jgi:DNA polymerase-3 subunit delta
VHATAFLSQREQWQPVPVVVLTGEELHLKTEVLRSVLERTLGGTGDDLDYSRYAGSDVDLKSVRDELLTVSMFSSARAVVIDDADEFISRHRGGLEEYFDRPGRSSLLVLSVKSWPKTTRLAKKLPQIGVEVDCSELAGAALQRWIADEAQGRYGKSLSRDALSLLVELAGTGLGLLARELDKLAAYAGEREKITADDVRTLVGGWRAETTWEMINAVRDGRPDVALHSLDRLLQAGEPAPKLLGGINFVFRKFAEATERSRAGAPLKAALQQAGVFPRDQESSESYLRRIGRPRAERILAWLADADSDLKGGSRVPERLQLEQLLLNLSGTLPLA